MPGRGRSGRSSRWAAAAQARSGPGALALGAAGLVLAAASAAVSFSGGWPAAAPVALVLLAGALLVLFAAAATFLVRSSRARGALDGVDPPQARASRKATRGAPLPGAAAAAEATSAYLGRMSHEIRTPLNAILGTTDALMQGPLETGQRDAVATIRAGAERLHGLLGDLLEDAELASGTVRLERRPVVVRDVVEQAVGTDVLGAHGEGVQVRSEVAPNVPLAIQGDPARLRQLLRKLVSSAAASSGGDVGVRVEARPGRRSGWHRLTFLVSAAGAPRTGRTDDPAEARSPGTASDETARSELAGTIAARLASLMRGSLAVGSGPGKGPEHRVTLEAEEAPPAALPPAASAASAAQVQTGPAAQAMAARPLRILLAEDNAVNEAVALRMVRQLGHDAEVARDGVEAVEAAGRAVAAGRPFDLILMDVQMPRLDGLEATRRIRSGEAGRSRIVAMTADAMPGDRERCLAAGMDDYIPKPVRLEVLARALAAAEAA